MDKDINKVISQAVSQSRTAFNALEEQMANALNKNEFAIKEMRRFLEMRLDEIEKNVSAKVNRIISSIVEQAKSDQRDYITTKEAAQIMGVTENTVREHWRNGRIGGSRKTGGKILLSRNDVYALMGAEAPVSYNSLLSSLAKQKVV